MKVAVVFGTRPEIIRLSQVIPLLDRYVETVLIHTGQNYDPRLSDIFFEELSLRQPDVHLGVNAAGFAEQASAILARGDHAAAEPYFLGWVKELQTRQGERAASDLREALPRLAALYESWGKPAEAAKWRATWAALPPPVERGPVPRVAD